jgi:hypothetical protein
VIERGDGEMKYTITILISNTQRQCGQSVFTKTINGDTLMRPKDEELGAEREEKYVL